jgi:hypothetical protein
LDQLKDNGVKKHSHLGIAKPQHEPVIVALLGSGYQLTAWLS